jgi:uncharacterized protein (TIGR02145 family)
MKLLYNFLFSLLLLTSYSCRNIDFVDNNIKETNPKLLDELPGYIIDTITDERDNSKYATIKIGNQIWIKGAINHKTSTGRMYRDNLYNWDAAIIACPKSFKVPSEKDWSELFQFVYDSIIKKSSPKLINRLSENFGNFTCNECSKNNINARLPYQFRLDSTIAKLVKYDLSRATNIMEEMVLMSYYLERIGFCTYGNGFKYNGGLGSDDNSYFWSSSTNNSGNHKYIRIYNGDYCKGCGYTFEMPNNNDFGFNLKCIKSN